MTDAHRIISDEEISRVHAYANFGSMSPRDVVNDGVKKYAVGYQGGSTQVAILREHGLITKPKGSGYRADLTEKGKLYARAIYHDDTRTDIHDTAKARIAELVVDVEHLNQFCIDKDARIAELEAALRALMELNDNHSPFGGEMYQDRIERTWDAAREALKVKP